MEEIQKMRARVDRIVSERSFLNRREQSEMLAFEAAKGSFHDTLERYKTVLERQSSEGKKVQIKLQELQIILTEQRAKVDSLNNYTVKAKEYTAEIKKLNECAGTVYQVLCVAVTLVISNIPNSIFKQYKVHPVAISPNLKFNCLI